MTSREADALLSRAIELHRDGRARDAIPLYRRALRRDRELTQAHGNLGRAYTEVERFDKALEHFALAYLGAPEAFGNRSALVDTLVRTPDFRVGSVLRRALAALAADPLVSHQRLVPCVAGLLKGEPPVAKALRRIEAQAGLTRRELGPELYRSLCDPLVLRLLSDCVFSDPDVEALLTASRSVWLEAVLADWKMTWPSHELLAAIGLQAVTTEWVYPESADERTQLARLETVLDEAHARVTNGTPSRALLIYALYRPLDRYAEDPVLLSAAADGRDPGSELMHRQLIEPARERALAAALPQMTDIVDGVSTRVRDQYEERPYPRWRSLPQRAARPVGEVLAGALESPELARNISMLAPRILIAGCGTGRHAIATATRFTGAQVLAVDLSLSSLGFAARRAEELGIDNIAFTQGDILGLGDHAHRYDVVECSGVLHHLSDPEAGWQILRGLLEPHGLMRIAVYSDRGRAFLDPIHSLVVEQGFDATADGIRALRAAIRCLPEDALARGVCASPDFYALSGCRDLFFPAHEDRFDLSRIARALERFDLDFLGFELPDPRVRRLYREQFPGDPSTRDLDNWDRLEARIPSLFTAMYPFWCRANA